MELAMEEESFVAIEKAVPTGPVVNPPAALQFFPTAEGFYDYQNKEYIYQYKDHLGNVRLSFKQGSSLSVEVVDQNDYYPFGLIHAQTNNRAITVRGVCTTTSTTARNCRRPVFMHLNGDNICLMWEGSLILIRCRKNILLIALMLFLKIK